ncbi:MAG TPA: PrpF domain-containing protein [Candidatus Methylomirabilis sp.]|nr:PrpF domain-containing protein [Candidatus Methylomirabilis sp.]
MMQQIVYGYGGSARAIRVAIVRGGTSKGIFILRNDLPSDEKERDKIILRLFGSPDLRQIDGLGGAELLTSKVAIIGPSTHKDAAVDYLFGQVGINVPAVDYAANCGNLSAAVGPFALFRGLAESQEAIASIRIHMVNVGKVITARFPVEGGQLKALGDYAIDGVPGTAARIDLDYAQMEGGILRKGLLPTGHVRDTFRIEGVGDIEASVVDAGNLGVFVRAADLGVSTEASLQALQQGNLIRRLEDVRAQFAEQLGLIVDRKALDTALICNPFFILVGPPCNYPNHLTGGTVEGESVDVVCRLVANATWHKAYAVTGTIATGAAARVKGSIVHEAMRAAAHSQPVVRIGHPAGVIDIKVSVSNRNDTWTLQQAWVGRTARILSDGWSFLPVQ